MKSELTPLIVFVTVVAVATAAIAWVVPAPAVGDSTIVVGDNTTIIEDNGITLDNLVVNENLTVGGVLDPFVEKAGDTMGGDLDMDHNFALRMNLRHFVHFTLEAGATDITLESIPAGVLEQDFHVYKLAASVDAAPGDGKTVSGSITNGTDTMTVSITGAVATTSFTTDNAFDVDVSAQSFTLKYTQSAGGSSLKGTVLVMYYYTETA